MSDNQKDDSGTNIEMGATVTKAFVSLAAIVAGHHLKIPELSIAGIVGGGLVDIAKAYFKDHSTRRTLLVGAGYAEGEPSKDPEDLVRSFEEKKKDTETGQSFFEAVEAAMRAIDEDVVPYIGYLLSLHANKKLGLGKPFFRSFTRMLTEIDYEELLALRELMTKAVGQSTQSVQIDISNPEWNVHASMRLMYLLKREGLASDLPGGFMNVVSGPHVGSFELPTIREIMSVIAHVFPKGTIFDTIPSE